LATKRRKLKDLEDKAKVVADAPAQAKAVTPKLKGDLNQRKQAIEDMRDNLNTAENITTIFKKFPPARVKLSDSWMRNVFLVDHTGVERGALYLRGFTSKE